MKPETVINLHYPCGNGVVAHSGSLAKRYVSVWCLPMWMSCCYFCCDCDSPSQFTPQKFSPYSRIALGHREVPLPTVFALPNNLARTMCLSYVRVLPTWIEKNPSRGNKATFWSCLLFMAAHHTLIHIPMPAQRMTVTICHWSKRSGCNLKGRITPGYLSAAPCVALLC